MNTRAAFFAGLIFLILWAPMAVLAQEDTGPTLHVDPAEIDTGGITDDNVNDVAEQLYCPVCENIPLDDCGTAACNDWREEIRLQLAQGMGEEAIIDDFIRRFGQRVVGTPQDPLLRAISLVTPWLLVGGSMLILGWVLLQWRGGRDEHILDRATIQQENAADSLRARLERDVHG